MKRLRSAVGTARALHSASGRVLRPDLFSPLVERLVVVDLGSDNYSGVVEGAYGDLIGNFPLELWCGDGQGNSETQKLVNGAKDLNIHLVEDFVLDGSTATFYMCEPKAMSGLFPPNEPLWNRLGFPTAMVQSIPVETVTLDSIVGEGPVHLLKMDIQGAELAVLASSPEVTSEVLVIQAELDFKNLFIGAPAGHQVMMFLESNGFELWTFSSIGTWSEGSLLRDNRIGRHDFSPGTLWWSRSVAWAIGVFVRRAVTAEEALLQAAILHTAYKGYDVARQALVEAGHPVLREYDRELSRIGLL